MLYLYWILVFLKNILDLRVAPKNGSKNELSEMSLDLQASYPLLLIKRNFLEFF